MGFPSKNTGVGCHSLLQGSSPPRDQQAGYLPSEPPEKHPHPPPTPASDPAFPSYLGLNYSRASCPLAGSKGWCGPVAGAVWVVGRASGVCLCRNLLGLGSLPAGAGPSGLIGALGMAPVLSRPRSPRPVCRCPGRDPPHPGDGIYFSICRGHGPHISTLAHEADRGTSRETWEGDAPRAPPPAVTPLSPALPARPERGLPRAPSSPQPEPALRALQV